MGLFDRIECTSDDCAKDSGPKGASLGGSGHFDRAIEDVGIDLHDERALFSDSSAGDDFCDAYTKFHHTVNDFEGSESGGFDSCSVNFCGGGVEGLTDEKSREEGVDEDCAVAIVPVESEESRFARF